LLTHIMFISVPIGHPDNDIPGNVPIIYHAIYFQLLSKLGRQLHREQCFT
jgi:hypothetical protein